MRQYRFLSMAKNYFGILQTALRWKRICMHFSSMVFDLLESDSGKNELGFSVRLRAQIYLDHIFLSWGRPNELFRSQ